MRRLELARNKEISSLRLQENIRKFYIKYLTRQLSEEEQEGIVMSLQKVKLFMKYQNICEKCKEIHQIKDDDDEMNEEEPRGEIPDTMRREEDGQQDSSKNIQGTLQIPAQDGIMENERRENQQNVENDELMVTSNEQEVLESVEKSTDQGMREIPADNQE